MANTKKKKSVATDHKTLKLLKFNGFRGDIVSRRAGPNSVDFCNFADLIVWDIEGVAAVQSTTTSNYAARVRKCITNPDCRDWIMNGNRVLILAWVDSNTVRECWLGPMHLHEFDNTGKLPKAARKVAEK